MRNWVRYVIEMIAVVVVSVFLAAVIMLPVAMFIGLIKLVLWLIMMML